MDIYCIKLIRIAILFIIFQVGYGQSNFSGSMQPQITFKYKITPLYTHVNGLEERHFFNRDGSSFWKTQQLDLFHFSQLRILDNQSIAVGIQYRFREMFEKRANDELRFTEQYAYNRRGFSVRYGHRFRAEQRIETGQTTHRFRYRFMLDFPVTSQTLDVNEIYIALGTESLHSISSSIKPEWDQRLIIDFGWFLTKSINIELGFEHRIENYTSKVAQKLFFNSGLNFSI